MWQNKKYQFITLFIYLYEDHLVWDEVGFAGREFTLYYTDIISVSGGNGGRLLGGASRFEINTAGQTYKYSSTLGGFDGLDECIQIINERIQYFRKKETAAVHSASFTNTININPDNIEPTITRIEMFLEDEEWDNARAYANAALDYFPTDYRPYLFLLMEELKVSSIEELEKCGRAFTDNKYFKKVKRFADDSFISRLMRYSDAAEIDEQEKEKQDLQVAQKEKEKQDLLAVQQLKATVLGEYKGINAFTAGFSAAEDHLTYKGRDYYYKDMTAFYIQKMPASSLSTGIIYVKTNSVNLLTLFFKYADKDRVAGLTTYINDKLYLPCDNKSEESSATVSDNTISNNNETTKYEASHFIEGHAEALKLKFEYPDYYKKTVNYGIVGYLFEQESQDPMEYNRATAFGKNELTCIILPPGFYKGEEPNDYAMSQVPKTQKEIEMQIQDSFGTSRELTFIGKEDYYEGKVQIVCLSMDGVGDMEVGWNFAVDDGVEVRFFAPFGKRNQLHNDFVKMICSFKK